MVGQAPRATGLVVQYLVQQHPRRAAERQLAREQLIENHSQAVDVRAAVDAVRLALGLLRAHVRRRAEDLAVDGHRYVCGLPLGQAEVHQLRLTVFIEHDVGGLDVPMDNAHLVGVLQCVRDGGDELRRLAGRRPLGGHADRPA